LPTAGKNYFDRKGDRRDELGHHKRARANSENAIFRGKKVPFWFDRQFRCFERLKPEYSFALGAIREVNPVKISSLLLSLFLALAVAPAFSNSVTLYSPAPNSGGLSSDWGVIASCSCFGGYWQNSAVNGKY
jgi:hypothetical protein